MSVRHYVSVPNSDRFRAARRQPLMKILLIGCGFIGRHFLQEAARQGHQVSVLDHRRENKAAVDARHETILGDIRDRSLIQSLVIEFDCVVNLAGILGTSETVDDPVPSIETNLLGAVNVFDGLRRPSAHAGRRSRCVQISVGNHFMNNTYAVTKSSAERFAMMYNKEHGTEIAVVRALNAYGPHQKHAPVRKVIPNFIIAALKNRPIPVFGSGDQVMDMIYVEDVARILLKAATAPSVAIDSVIEAGTGRRTTVNDIATIILSLTGSTAGMEHLPMRPGELPDSEVLARTDSMKKLGIQVESLTRLEDGLARTIPWYKANYPWMEC